jgi:hypothetical protein
MKDAADDFDGAAVQVVRKVPCWHYPGEPAAIFGG